MRGRLPDDAERRIFSVPEAAEILGIGVGSYYAGVKRGELPGQRIGRRLVVPGFGLLRLLDSPSPNGHGSSPPE